jgi:hypothetical protein
MSDALNIQNIQSLYDLKNALGRFAEGTQENLHAAETEISRTEKWLEERIQNWMREVERAQHSMEDAASNLRRCQASGYRDRDGYYHRPDCSSESQALKSAEQRLQEFKENLAKSQAWQSRVAQVIAEYRREARRLAEIVESRTEKAQTFLAQTAAKYESVRESERSVGVNAAMATESLGFDSAIANPAPSQEALKGLSSDESYALVQKWLHEGVSVQELERLKILKAETLVEDEKLIYELLESRRFYEATRGLWTGQTPQGGDLLGLISSWAQSLAGGIADMSKVVQYWKDKE